VSIIIVTPEINVIKKIRILTSQMNVIKMCLLKFLSTIFHIIEVYNKNRVFLNIRHVSMM